MTLPTPRNANDFIEQQLDNRAAALEKVFESDQVTLIGGLTFGVDDLLRNVIEDKRRKSSDCDTLTFILTTGGGFIEIVQRIVDTIRYQYKHVNFVVPNYAYSAGTVLVMSGDEIYMDYYSRLGPIDPQVEIAGGRTVPALGYLIQWERLLSKARKGEITLPEVQLMIEGFNQAELYQYEQARELSIALLKEWLVKYKFKNWKRTKTRKKLVTKGMRTARASTIAKQLNDTEKWHIHGYGISMEVLRRDLKLIIDDFGGNNILNEPLRDYYSLLDDYMLRRGDRGVIHTQGVYLPYMYGSA